MNKLFTKIAALALGAAMVVGVGVSIGSKSRVAPVEAAAESQTFTFGSSGSDISGTSAVTKGSITVTCSKNNGFNAGSVKLALNNGTLVISSSGAKLASVTITDTASKYGLTANAGTINNGSWTGDVSTVTFTKTSGQQCTVSQVVVTLADSGGGATGKKFEKITTAAGLSDGASYLICNPGGTKVMAGQASNNRSAVNATVSQNQIEYSDTMELFTLHAEGNFWSFEAKNLNKGYIYAASSGNNYLRTESSVSNNSKFSIVFSNGTPTLTAQGNYTRNVMQYNSGSSIFACYGSASQQAVSIWKEVASKTPASLALSGTYPTSFYVGDEFSHEGMTVTVTYENQGGTSDVTSSAVFTGYDMDTAGEQEVTVSYTENEKTVTANYDITVNTARTLQNVYLDGDMSKKSYYATDTDWDLTGLSLKGIWSEGEDTVIGNAQTLYSQEKLVMTFSSTPTKGQTTLTITELMYEDEDENIYESVASYSKVITGIEVTDEPDVIDRAFTGVTTSTYTDWSNKAGSSGSGAVYAGKSSGGTDVQLNNTNPNGIWTTSSGGIFTGIRVQWNSSTSDGRFITIYGKNTAYESGDLYNSDLQGEAIGTISKGSSTIDGDLGSYKFIGIKANNALYLTKIEIWWTPALPEIEYTNGGTSESLTVVNGSDNSTTFKAENFASVTKELFSYTPTTGVHATLDFSVSGTTVTVTATGSSVGGPDEFTISATGCANTLTLIVTVQSSTTFDSLTITTQPSSKAFSDGQAFAVTDMVVSANFTVGSSAVSETFSADSGADHPLTDLSFTVAGEDYEIGDALDVGTGTKAVVVSYHDSVTGTTRSAASYNITIGAYQGNSYTKVTGSLSDWRGTYLIVCEYAEAETPAYNVLNGSLAKIDGANDFVDVASNYSNGTITVTKSMTSIDSYAFTIGRTSDGYYIKSSKGTYIANTGAGNGLTESPTVVYNNAIEWDSENDCIKITSLANESPTYMGAYGSSTSMRFRYYTTQYTQSTGSQGRVISIYKLNDNGYVAEANTYASTFLSSVTCSGAGTAGSITSVVDWDSDSTTSLKSKFLALSVDAQGYLAMLTGDESDGATGAAGAVGRYDYIIRKYKTSTYSDFMDRIAAGTLVVGSERISLFDAFGENNTGTTIIIIVSVIGVSALGGFFFLRKRKEI